MRHYDRLSYRHLNDSERYRDPEYLADDGWIGPNERVPHGMMDENEPPWSTLGGYDTGALLREDAFENRRGQGRTYGRDLGEGYGRDYDVRRTFERSEGDDYDRGYSRPREREGRLEYPRQGFDVDERTQQPRGGRPGPVARARGMASGVADGVSSGMRDIGDVIRHPRSFVGRMVRGIFHGKGPKNWMRSDTRIHDEVCELLAHHPHIDASEIDVVVKDGEVTLEGTVADRRMKRLADEVLDGVLGVHDVHNRLRVARAAGSEKAPSSVKAETHANGNGTRSSAHR